MREVKFSGAEHACQLTVSVDADNPPTQVVIGLESAPEGQFPHHWLLHHCDPQTARDIAASLIRGAELVEGSRDVDSVQTSEEVEGFHEHG